jgi:hypothetical protein
MKFRIVGKVPAETAPRCTTGVDFGALGLIIARASNATPDEGYRLVWRRGHSYCSGRTTVYAEACLQWFAPSRWDYDRARPSYIHKGGRLSKELLIGLQEEIGQRFGLMANFRQWDRKHTLIFEAVEQPPAPAERATDDAEESQ